MLRRVRIDQEAYGGRTARGRSASSRSAPTASTAPARSAPRRSGPKRQPGGGRRGPSESRAAPRPPRRPRLRAARRAARRGRRRSAPPGDCPRRPDPAAARLSPSGASRARSRSRARSGRRPSAASQSSASCPPPSRAASSITRGPSAASRTCVYVGPLRTPSAAAAARAASTAAAVSCSDGHTCASATPNAGGSARIRSVTVSGTNSPSTENAFTVTSGPSTSSSTSHAAARATPRWRGRPPRARSSGRTYERQPALALPVGRLDDAGERGGAARRPLAHAARRRPRSARAGAPSR